MSQDLDLFVKLGRLIQVEEKGKNAAGVETTYGKETSQYAEDGRRIALHSEDWIDENAKREAQRAATASAAAHGDGHGHEHHGHDHGHG